MYPGTSCRCCRPVPFLVPWGVHQLVVCLDFFWLMRVWAETVCVAKIGRKRTLLAFSAVFIVGAVRFFFLFKKVMFVLCD